MRYLKQHVKKIHSREALAKKRQRASRAAKSKQAQGGYRQCEKCNKFCKEGSSFINHSKRCGQGPAKVKCDHCEMEFKRREDMQAHALIHMGMVTCPIHNILFK